MRYTLHWLDCNLCVYKWQKDRYIKGCVRITLEQLKDKILFHLDLTQPCVLVRVNIVAARLTNICNKTMCALLSSARLGMRCPGCSCGLWPGCSWVVTWPGLGLLQHSGDRVTLCLERRERGAAREGRHGGEQENEVDTTHITGPPACPY